MSRTAVARTRTTKGILLTAIAVGLYAVGLSTFFEVGMRDVIPLSLVFGVFVAMAIGLGTFLIDVVRYFE